MVRMLLGLAILGLPLGLSGSPLHLSQAKAKNVLVMYSYYERDQTSLKAIESAVRSHVPGPVNFSVEYLQSPRFEDLVYRDSLAGTLQHEYEGKKPDLVLAASEPALRFAVQYRDIIFPGAPIVFWAISSSLAYQKMPGVTGIATPASTRDTIRLALGLEPDTTSVALIAGTSEIEQYWLKDVQKELHQHQEVTEIDIVGPPSGELLNRIAELPPHTVIVFLLFPEDLNQPAISNWDVLAAASERLPVYSLFPTLALDRGGIGGAYYDGDEDAVAAGELAARVLSGEEPDKIPVVTLPGLKIKVDWRQLQRWHIPESTLPPGTVVLNKPPDVWQLYKWYMAAAITLILLEAGLIVALLWARKQRRRTEEELGITYDRLALAVTAGISVGWDLDYKAGTNRWFGDLQTVFGIPGGSYEAGVSDFAKWVYQEDREWVLAALERAQQHREPYAAEFRVIRTDGTVRWISARGKFYFSQSGEAERMLGMATDVTGRKLAEEAVYSLSGKLIRAQEEERQRIAREIHDDHQQRIALLAIELSSLAQEINGTNANAANQLADIWNRITQLGSDLQSLSHRLHSSTLDSMGLVPALKRLCREFTKYQQLDVDLVAENVPDAIPHEVALSLFRVTQEALQNVRKHSRAQGAEVRVEGLEGKIRLWICDDGVGFDLRGGAGGSGIGLRSMAERLRLVNGHFEVRSRPAGGTVIEAWAPITTRPAAEIEIEEGDASSPPEHTIA
jgi:signal transduction histidine kinase/ABC-type uncharacterized transport system substrate-binding protein